MRHLRAIVRTGMLAAYTFVMYATLILGLALVFEFNRVARRWRGFVFQTWARTAAAILRVKIAVRGIPPGSPFLLVSNHLSYLDVLVFASQLRCVFVARGDVARWPVVGSLCRGVGTIFIDRQNRGDVRRVNDVIDNAQRDGGGVVLFAEGTSTRGDRVLPFKSSLLEPAARASLPVAYATISYRTPEGEAPADLSVCWWGEMTFLKHVIGLMYLTEIHAVVGFGAVQIVSSNRKALAAKLWAAVNEEFIASVERSEFNLQVAALEAGKLKPEL